MTLRNNLTLFNNVYMYSGNNYFVIIIVDLMFLCDCCYGGERQQF